MPSQQTLTQVRSAHTSDTRPPRPPNYLPHYQRLPTADYLTQPAHLRHRVYQAPRALHWPRAQNGPSSNPIHATGGFVFPQEARRKAAKCTRLPPCNEELPTSSRQRITLPSLCKGLGLRSQSVKSAQKRPPEPARCTKSGPMRSGQRVPPHAVISQLSAFAYQLLPCSLYFQASWPGTAGRCSANQRLCVAAASNSLVIRLLVI